MVVVWAEDDASDRRLIQLALETLPGAPPVQLVDNGAQAVELAATLHPSLVVLDVQMPVMDGIAALERLRQQPATWHIPVVMFSSCADSTRKERCLRLGASAYACKPLQVEDFQRAVAGIIQQANPATSTPA
ncbi:MAG: two-component system, sensor histidine kinase and response regulator [Thermoplasmata archaeon]|jgi:CheY-like chemotaxis protein|nr:two-component system, sensor histidine kinase and response regulator [Thermoplasmata archaeon]